MLNGASPVPTPRCSEAGRSQQQERNPPAVNQRVPAIGLPEAARGPNTARGVANAAQLITDTRGRSTSAVAWKQLYRTCGVRALAPEEINHNGQCAGRHDASSIDRVVAQPVSVEPYVPGRPSPRPPTGAARSRGMRRCTQSAPARRPPPGAWPTYKEVDMSQRTDAPTSNCGGLETRVHTAEVAAHVDRGHGVTAAQWALTRPPAGRRHDHHSPGRRRRCEPRVPT